MWQQKRLGMIALHQSLVSDFHARALQTTILAMQVPTASQGTKHGRAGAHGSV
jgi:hypothetical protein